MAGDWIKMRSDLLTSPKVVRIASALDTDRFRVIGGLLSVWSLFDAHSVDGHLIGYDIKTLDEIAAWAGFAVALESVGWLIQEQDSLLLPRFDSHNGASAKRRAQEADRKRLSRQLAASNADKTVTREEKNREEKIPSKDTEPALPAVIKTKKEAKPALGVKDLVAEGVNEQHAIDWLKVRKAKRAPLTETAWEDVKREARKALITPADAVRISAASSWQGFKASWLQNQSGLPVASAAAPKGSRNTRDIPLAEDLSDRSWATKGGNHEQ